MLDGTQRMVRDHEARYGTFTPDRRAPGVPAGAPLPLSAHDSSSRAYRHAMRELEQFARHGVPTVLLEGESGTGKTAFAARLHAVSRQARGPLVHVNLAAVDPALAGSELFGHVAGAYTGANKPRGGLFLKASGGTLFLDEVGKAPRAVQERLLTAVEYRRIRPVGGDVDIPVDAHVIAATNVPLDELVEQGEFLPDLLPRLATFSVRIPPLRERREDIPQLVERAVGAHAPRFGYVVAPAVNARLLKRLVEYEWPYNLRQLDGVVQRLLMLADGDAELTPAHCAETLDSLLQRTPTLARSRLSVQEVRASVDRHGTIAAAARELGVARTTVYAYLRRGTEGDTAHEV